MTDAHAEHSLTEHEHGADRGRPIVQHGEHVDSVHDGRRRAVHAGQSDEH